MITTMARHPGVLVDDIERQGHPPIVAAIVKEILAPEASSLLGNGTARLNPHRLLR